MSDIQTSEDKGKTFEDFGHENGIKYWWATEYSQMLGYSTYSSFMNVINRAIKSCMNANVDHFDDFRSESRIVDGKSYNDFKLSRFACYMIAMNADIKKPVVARAQAYFAEQVERINVILEGSNEIERLNIRDEIRGMGTPLNSVAKSCGVVNYALFHDAGYKGLYNRSLKAVKQMKGIKDTVDHFDFMGRTELAANLFRMTMTEERLKNRPVSGQNAAMQVHNKVGKEVRDMVKRNTGLNPEDLPVERRLGEVKKAVKSAKKLNQENK